MMWLPELKMYLNAVPSGTEAGSCIYLHYVRCEDMMNASTVMHLLSTWLASNSIACLAVACISEFRNRVNRYATWSLGRVTMPFQR